MTVPVPPDSSTSHSLDRQPLKPPPPHPPSEIDDPLHHTHLITSHVLFLPQLRPHIDPLTISPSFPLTIPFVLSPIRSRQFQLARGPSPSPANLPNPSPSTLIPTHSSILTAPTPFPS